MDQGDRDGAAQRLARAAPLADGLGAASRTEAAAIAHRAGITAEDS